MSTIGIYDLEIAEVNEQRQIVGWYALGQLFRAGIWRSDDQVEDSSVSGIALTPLGNSFVERLLQQGVSSAHARMAAFFILAGRDGFLLDLEQSKIDSLITFLNIKISERTVLYPYIYGRLLYDKAYRIFDEPPRNLTLDQTLSLLADTPVGICQYAHWLVGPLGVIRAESSRLIPFSNSIPLWHCENYLCSSLHTSTLSSAELTPRGISAAFRKAQRKEAGGEDPLLDFVFSRLSPDTYMDDFWPSDLPSLIGNAFTMNELGSLASELLRNTGRQLLERVPNLIPERAGSRSELPQQLSEHELVQLILACSDDAIMAALDETIGSRAILIPDSEVRDAVFKPPKTWQNVRCQCSSLGVRVIGSHSMTIPLARLKRLVMFLHREPKAQKDLVWILRKSPGDTAEEKLENYINVTSPAEVVAKFVFASPEALRTSLEHIRAKHLPLPTNETEERTFIDVMLWKIGFPRTSFISQLEAFRDRLTQFRAIALVKQSSGEKWKEQVRSVGVNFFVSLEEVLDISLAFATWLLLADYPSEVYKFNVRRARQLAASSLSGLVSTSQGPVVYNPSGRNTLFPLLTLFSALEKHLKDLLAGDHAEYLKPETEIAFFAHEEGSLQSFPYRHRHFLFDGSSTDIDRALNLIEDFPKSLFGADVLTVRNNIPHISALFPSREQIEGCCAVVEEQIDKLEAFGLLPLVYGTNRVETDKYLRMCTGICG